MGYGWEGNAKQETKVKFKLTSKTKVWLGKTLYRIEALIDFGSVKAGDKGGFVEKEENLSQSGNAWVSDDAQVSDDARVSGNAWVYGNAQVSPINMTGMYYNVTIIDAYMRIGCEQHTFDQWEEYDDRRILEMDGKSALKFWQENKTILMAMCRIHEKKVIANV
jgi:hypothetical protein